ncbi:MAG: ATP-binding cassette domain-containing protein [Acidobacteriota bacterium]
MDYALAAIGLTKEFRVPEPFPGGSWLRRLRHFVKNPSTAKTVVDDLTFTVEKGEVLGFLGANGSGKSTTIKMLTGILTPTSGEIDALGFSPHGQRKAYTRRIGVVFGQKSLLWWNIPVIESFKLYRDIYGQSNADFEARLKRFADILEIHDYLHVPVRKLSLGMRMRAEIAASLLHQPEIIFLDEPTIGLDVLGRRNLKRFLKRVNEEEGTTILLTTHNMFDVEDLCKRCVLLKDGRKVYEGDIATLKSVETTKTIEFDVLQVISKRTLEAALRRGHLLEQSKASYRLRVAADDAVDVIGMLFESARLENLNIVPPSLESVIERIFEARDPGKESSVAALHQAAL